MHTDSTNVKRGSKAAQSEATRAKLVKVARRLFAKRGYSAVGTEDVVKRGDKVRVKLLEVDERGRMRLSRKALLEAPEPARSR